jgi:chromatin remodeling complex protein RSC6
MAPKRISSNVPLQTAVPVQIVKSEVPAPVAAAPAETPVAPAPKKKTLKKKEAAAPAAPLPAPVAPVAPVEAVEEDVVGENVEAVAEDVVAEETEGTGEDKKRTRRVVNKDSVRADFNTLWAEYAEELSVKKKSKKLSLQKYLLRLQTDVFKLLKVRPVGDDKKPRVENNSGFMKPVNITPELADFINVNTSVPITRVLITKKICEYIKEKDLQNPKDRREILPDPALKRIFKLTDGEKEPLTYYSMQKKIQSHIFKV